MDHNLLDRSNYTPMMQQYLEIKKDYSDFIVFFRLGDFYEMFFTDAIVASKELEIVLTGRDAGMEDKVPMCGVPHHAANFYIEKLIDKGFKVAIVEQIEDPQLAKGLVKRDVIKLITPGTIVEEGAVEEKSNNFIAAISETKTQFLLAYSDLTTGENHIITLPNDIDILMNEILNLNVRELVLGSDFNQSRIREYLNSYALIVSISDNLELPAYCKSLVQDIYDKELLQTFARLMNYLYSSQRRELMHMQKVQVFESSKYLHIDNNSRRNLELTETYRSLSRKGTLFWLLDKCQCAMGSRMLKSNIMRPLVDKEKIEERYRLVEAMSDNFIIREEIRNLLKEVYDLERIVGRLSFGNANGKDLVNLARSLKSVPGIKSRLLSLEDDLANRLLKGMEDFTQLEDLIGQAIVEDPPFSVKEGGIIKAGYSSELDEIKYRATHGKEWLRDFEEKERERTGIKKLRIGYNRVFGYYIEVTKGQIDQIKPEFGYDRKQTLVNCERYITPELKEKESMILGSMDKSIQMEYELFCFVREQAKGMTDNLQKLAKSLAEVDMLTAFAIISIENGYVRPVLSNEKKIMIVEGRHPVVERTVARGSFVSNDLNMDSDTSILLITGPNMSGKSTYMRQLALIVIMAQIGCFVPAKSALLPVFDRIFTRIGASDDLSTGKSTFMVEMMEVNYALQNATENSLILFDEIGRGTATYDGMALAQAIIEYTHHKIACKVLFSTHYHELTYLEDTLKSLHNIHVMAKEDKGNIVFLHKVADGPTDRSYGIHVGKLAKLPTQLVRRAQTILEDLEKNHGYNVIKPQTVDLFNFETASLEEEREKSEYRPIIDQIKEIEINELTPLKAMNILASIIEEIKKIN